MLAPERILVHERPCRPATPVLTGPPARNTLIDEVIEFAQRPPADAAKIMPSAPDVRVEVDDQPVETLPRPSRLPPEFVSDAPQRLWTDVEVQSMQPPTMRVA